MADNCTELQLEEWQVLEAVYPDYILSDLAEHAFSLQISPQFPQTFRVQIESGSEERAETTVSSLPPIIIRITLPDTYPLSSPPRITSITVSADWISRKTIATALISAWTNNEEGILCTWVEILQNGEFLPSTDMIKLTHPTPKALLILLDAHEATTQSEHFSRASFFCSLCLASVKGLRCLRLNCSHTFCRSCLEEYWSFLIASGDVEKVGCPDEECVKAKREATREEVLRVVDDKLVERFSRLKEKNRLEKDPTTVHCPIPTCQHPVPKPLVEDEATSDSGWNRLRTCGSCGYSFCAFCKRSWHGPISHCPLSLTETFIEEYIALPEGDIRRNQIEQRYGKANVQKLVTRYNEEKANREWFKASAMACPVCETWIEKTEGCNHMTCGKCKAHFCYRCGTKLRPTDPFQHFSTKGNPCYGKLFEAGTENDDLEWIEWT